MNRCMALIAIGLLGLAAMYSLRPPAGVADAVDMVHHGRSFFLREPFFYAGLGLFGVLVAVATRCLMPPKDR